MAEDKAKPELNGQESDTKQETPGIDPAKMPFMAHLIELRSRLVKTAIAVGVGFGICYPFHVHLLKFMVDPLQKVLPPGQRLIYTSLPEAFFTYLKISVLAGVLLTFPFLVYQFWMFVARFPFWSPVLCRL